MTPSRAGYTLIEILAAFFLMTVLLTLVMGIFGENGRQREAAIELMRERLSSTGALEQLASDLEGAVFVSRAPDVDPEDHPWRFMAVDPGEYGSTALRFVTQNVARDRLAEHASGWAEVAYFLEQDAEGEWVLWRWRSARPPSEVTRGFPDSRSPGAMRLALGVADFGVRWLGPEGEWLDEWESTFQPPAQALPEAAEISLVLLRRAREGESEDGALEIPGTLQTKRIAIPMRPLDVAALVELGQDGDVEQADCYTLAACLDEGDSTWYSDLVAADCDGDDELCSLLANPGSVCWSEIESARPEIAALAPAACGS